MRFTYYDEHKKRWQVNIDYGAVMIDELNYAVGEAIDKLAAYEDAEEKGYIITPPNSGLKVYFIDKSREMIKGNISKIGNIKDFLFDYAISIDKED